MSVKSYLDHRIVSFAADQLEWPFRGEPHIRLQPRDEKAYGSQVQVDPFPCYSHDAGLVKEIAGICETQFPMGFDPTYYILPFEDLSRTNAYSSRHSIYKGDPPYPYEPYMSLSGKRIPLHPAMTRYLVAHEYGHLADYWITYKLGFDESSDEFRKDYAARRGITASFAYGGHRWHTSIGEIIANDFRILVCNVETEFWPHPGIARPEESAIRAFWLDAINDYAFRQ